MMLAACRWHMFRQSHVSIFCHFLTRSVFARLVIISQAASSSPIYYLVTSNHSNSTTQPSTIRPSTLPPPRTNQTPKNLSLIHYHLQETPQYNQTPYFHDCHYNLQETTQSPSTSFKTQATRRNPSIATNLSQIQNQFPKKPQHSSSCLTTATKWWLPSPSTTPS